MGTQLRRDLFSIRVGQSSGHLWKLLLQVGVVYFQELAWWWKFKVSTVD
jgi:hypothetical protein